ncbi:hypothetical protein AB9Q10_26575 [Streptomyces krungchingensis]
MSFLPTQHQLALRAGLVALEDAIGGFLGGSISDQRAETRSAQPINF